MSSDGRRAGRQSDCPGEFTLRRLGHLNWNGTSEVTLSSDDPSAAILEHVEACGSCQRRLEAIAVHDRSSLEQLLSSTDRTMRSASDFAELDEKVLKGFRILRLLGRGGQSRVYLAEELPTSRCIALKLIPVSREDAGPQREQWLTEVRAAASIEHQNVVRLYRVEETAAYFLLVFEYINGGTLRDWLTKPVSQMQVARFMERVARTVHQIHQRGILHLDLKPSNILMETGSGTSWELAVPKIADFGISSRCSRVDHKRPSPGVVRGTPSYMAPEQILGDSRQLSPASDVYGLGAVMYCMLTGNPPISFDPAADSLEQLLCAKIESPASLDSTIDRSLSEVTMKCLERKADGRFQSADAFAEALQSWIHLHSESAQSVTDSQRRWLPWLSVPLIAGVALIAVAGNWGDSEGTKTREFSSSASSASKGDSQLTFAEAFSELSGQVNKVGGLVDDQLLVQTLSELPAAFTVHRAARLALESRRFTDQLLSHSDVPIDQCLRFAALLHASGRRFQDGAIPELYSAARYLLEDSIRLHEFVLRKSSGNQSVLEQVIAARVCLATVRIEKGLNTPELVRGHYQSTLSGLIQTLPLVVELTDRRQRIYWAGYIMDSLRLQFWESRFAGDMTNIDLFRAWEQEAWSTFTKDHDASDIAVRHVLMHPDLQTLRTVDIPGQWVLPNSRETLQREFFFLRIADPFFRGPADGSDSDPRWSELLPRLSEDIRTLKVDRWNVPHLIHEDLIRPLTSLSTQWRAAGQLDKAEYLQRRYLELCESADQLFPENSDIQLALSEAHLQAWKNAIRRDQMELAVASLQKSLQAAQSAVFLSPESPRARDQVADRIKRLARFQASHDSKVTGAN